MARTDRHTAPGACTSTTAVTLSRRRRTATIDPQYKYPDRHSLNAPIALCWCHDGDVAHSEDPEDYAPTAHRVRSGTLLLANTDLLEPTFRRSVIYVLEHNDGGTLGVVLNRPSETAVYNVLPQWAKLTAKPKTMFIGGPVKRDAALCLATLRVGVTCDGVGGLRHVQGRMAMVDLDADPDTIAPMVEGVRIFAGYSGWTIGQLEGEIERDDWIVLSALPSDVLVEPRVDLWARVLRRQPLPLSLLATHPIDISRN
jgi:putative transcriptional regulator